MANRNKKGGTRTLRGIIDGVLPPNSVRRVAVVFVLLLAVLFPFALFSGGWGGWSQVTATTAAAGAVGARAIGVPATVTGNLIRLPSRTLSVDPQCTAVTLAAIYAALVLAYPVRWRRRLVGLVVGLPLLAIANIVRLAGVAFASETLSGKSFYVVHDYLFEFGMVFVVFSMWAVWLSGVRRTS